MYVKGAVPRATTLCAHGAYICVCVYIYIYKYIHIYIHTYTCIIYIYFHIFTYACLFLCIHICIYTYVPTLYENTLPIKDSNGFKRAVVSAVCALPLRAQ